MKQAVSHLDNCKMGPKAGSFYRIEIKEKNRKYFIGWGYRVTLFEVRRNKEMSVELELAWACGDDNWMFCLVLSQTSISRGLTGVSVCWCVTLGRSTSVLGLASYFSKGQILANLFPFCRFPETKMGKVSTYFIGFGGRLTRFF